MSAIDNALQALFDMAHKEVLWTNPSSNSTFPAQSISKTLKADDLILINYIAYGSDTVKSLIVPVGVGGILETITSNNGYTTPGSIVWAAWRKLTVSMNGIEFKNTFSYAGEKRNEMCVPTKIFRMTGDKK